MSSSRAKGLNGRILSRRPRFCQSCSAIEEEEEEEEGE